MTELGLGTYRCRDVAVAAQAAVAAGVTMIDTAPVYADGTAQTQLACALCDRPDVRVSTKVGHMTHDQAEIARRAGIVTAREAAACYSIAPRHVEHRLARNADELRRERIDLLYLHNPEHRGHGDRYRLREEITRAFAVCEQAVHEGRITGYGVATWSGFTDAAFDVHDLLVAAQDAAGSRDTHLQAIQLPINLVRIAPILETLQGAGPVAQAEDAGLEVWSSAPLNGGELAHMVTDELAMLVGPGLSPVRAALAVVASTPGLTGMLLSASPPAHWREATGIAGRPSIPPARLREICDVLRA